MNEAVRRQIGSRLKTARIKARLTQQEVATHFLRSRQTISSWEKGESLPTLLEFHELAMLYVTSADLILFDVKTTPTGGRMLKDIFRESEANQADRPGGF